MEDQYPKWVERTSAFSRVSWACRNRLKMITCPARNFFSRIVIATSKSQVKVKCTECGCEVIFARAKNAELIIHRKTIKDCHSTIASLIEAGKAEKQRRDTIESDLHAKIRELQQEIRYIQENRHS